MSPRQRVASVVYSISESSGVRLSLALTACGGIVWLVVGTYQLRDGMRTDLESLRREVQERYVTKEYIDVRLDGTQQVLEARIDGTERVLQARMDALSSQIMTLSERLDDSRTQGGK